MDNKNIVPDDEKSIVYMRLTAIGRVSAAIEILQGAMVRGPSSTRMLNAALTELNDLRDTLMDEHDSWRKP